MTKLKVEEEAVVQEDSKTKTNSNSDGSSESNKDGQEKTTEEENEEEAEEKEPVYTDEELAERLEEAKHLVAQIDRTTHFSQQMQLFNLARDASSRGLPAADGIALLFGAHSKLGANQTLAIEKLKEGVDQGYGVAASYLGVALRNGMGTTANPAAGLASYEQGVSLGSFDAMANLGTVLMDSPKEEEKIRARQLLERSAAVGHPMGVARYALCLVDGIGGDADAKEAARLFVTVEDKLHWVKFDLEKIPKEIVEEAREVYEKEAEMEKARELVIECTANPELPKCENVIVGPTLADQANIHIALIAMVLMTILIIYRLCKKGARKVMGAKNKKE